MRDLIGINYDEGSGGPELTAAEWRQTDTSLFLRDTNDIVMGGVRGGAVTNAGSSVTIAPLTVVVQTLAARGVYLAAFPAGAAELSKSITAAHTTLTRIDALDIKIYDHEADGSGLRGADIVLTAGIPGSGTAPAFTGVGIRLGTFNVPASGGGSPAWTQDTNLVGYASAGGIIDIATRPANPRPGTIIYNRTTGVLEQYHAGAWRNIFSSVWTSWVPGWTAATTNPQRGNGIEVGAYRMSGGMVDAYWKYQFNTTYVIGSGTYAWFLPVRCHADFAGQAIGQVLILDSSTGISYSRTAGVIDATNSFAAMSEGGTFFSSTSPVTLASGDRIGINLRYRPETEAP